MLIAYLPVADGSPGPLDKKIPFGLRLNIFSVQYHPESNPGPQDSVYLFQEFINNMKKNAKKKRS